MTNLIIASFVTVVSAALGEVAWKKVWEKERKENMRCKVPSSLSPRMESKKMKKSVDFSKAKTGEILDQPDSLL